MKQHTTRDGDSMLIAEMDTPHLINTVKFHLKRINQVKAAVGTVDTGSRFNDRLYGRRSTMEPEQAADLVSKIMEKLEPYLAEAFVRGLVDLLRSDVVAAYGRDNAIERQTNTFLLRSANDLGWTDNDDDDWAKDPDEGSR